MKFVSLHICNFLAIGSAIVRLDDRGLVLLQGENRDDTSAVSNGAGKSSIVDALCWTLYATTARGEEGDRVINRAAGKDCMVELEIQEGDTTYRIARYRKHKTGKNSLAVVRIDASGSTTDLAKGTDKLTQAVVNEIVGSSYEVFRNSIYAGQENFPDLPAMTDKQLKVLVEEAAGVTVLEKAYEDARNRLLEVKGRVEQVSRALAPARAIAEGIEADIETMKNSAEQFERTRADDVTRCTDAAMILIAEKKSITDAIAKIDEAGLRSAIAACDAALASLKEEQAEERRLANEVATAGNRESVTTALLDQARDTARKHVQAMRDVEARVGSPCDTCARPLTAAEIAPLRDAQMGRVQEARQLLKKAQVDAEEALATRQAHADSLSSFRATMTDASAKASQRASLALELGELERLKHDALRHLEQARDQANRAKLARDKENPFRAMLGGLETKRDRALAEERTLKERMSDFAKELRIAEHGAQAFSPAGVRAEVLDTVTPFLNAQTGKYLSVLSDDNLEAIWTTLVKTAKGELREKFGIEVTSRAAGERFTSVSGGEKRKVRIAAALALQDLVASRATKPIELFIGDEIDDALDDAGLERLMAILAEKARERGSVFVVSHRSLRDWIPQVLTVVKKDGRAEILKEAA